MLVGERRAELAQFFEQAAIDPFPVVGRFAAARFASRRRARGFVSCGVPCPLSNARPVSVSSSVPYSPALRR